IVGPELSLQAGIVDAFTERGLTIFGPTRQAAMLETSKSFAKKLLKKYGIPTPQFEVFDTSADAIDYAGTISYPAVIKADGIAAGKGVIIAEDSSQAIAAIKDIMDNRVFGDAGKVVLIEEFMEGAESSYFVLSNERGFLPLGSARDYKRLRDHDDGPNTGGMGSISPSDKLTPELEEKVVKKIVYPLMEALEKEGIVYRGVLYAGLMIVDDEPYVLEFNARFGDPETQALLPRVEGEMVGILTDSAKGRMFSDRLSLRQDVSVCVVMASKGYPASPQTDNVIEGLKDAIGKDIFIFHAGTRNEKGIIKTAGGRVLGVTALGESMKAAREKAYRAIGSIVFEGSQFRSDIGL
ncbi:MAG: phosphoribosylamine--glycine ligase, partial [Deltaproteobacteria bacterium]|nr:phosphoribosylamine--glycine ligase [Deltaproteobacteria bacterium]